ncbi:hypothetical protein BC835DRAFT_229674 [Cytidiella melzeri]|nr:hypothetical protein BC835DRAFT_229674 [Cytidiella melzeri]
MNYIPVISKSLLRIIERSPEVKLRKSSQDTITCLEQNIASAASRAHEKLVGYLSRSETSQEIRENVDEGMSDEEILTASIARLLKLSIRPSQFKTSNLSSGQFLGQDTEELRIYADGDADLAPNRSSKSKTPMQVLRWDDLPMMDKSSCSPPCSPHPHTHSSDEGDRDFVDLAINGAEDRENDDYILRDTEDGDVSRHEINDEGPEANCDDDLDWLHSGSDDESSDEDIASPLYSQLLLHHHTYCFDDSYEKDHQVQEDDCLAPSAPLYQNQLGLTLTPNLAAHPPCFAELFHTESDDEVDFPMSADLEESHCVYLQDLEFDDSLLAPTDAD